MQTVSKAVKDLLIKSQFYGLFLTSLNKQFSKSISTAGVGIEGINCKLWINPDFWKPLPSEQKLHIMWHEVLHLVFFHHTDFKDADRMYGHSLTNIAMDCEVESFIPESLWLEEGTATKLMKMLQLPKQKGTWWYLKTLKHLKDQIDQSGNSGGNSSGQSGGKEPVNGANQIRDNYNNLNSQEQQEVKDLLENGDDLNVFLIPDDENLSELIKGQIEHQIKEAAKAAGSVPGELKETLNRILQVKPPIYNWKRAFRRLLGNSYNISTKMTRRKESNRFDGNPGIKFKKKSSILIGIDTSGSVSEKELQDFFSEIYHVWKAGTRVHIIEWDTCITNEYDYNGHMPKYITGRGGTDPNPSIEYYNNHIKDYQSFINFTDAYFYQNEYIKPKQTMYWVITSDGYQNLELPGIKINIPKL